MYNRKYWKIPLVLAAATACTYAVSWNARLYNEYHTAYVDFMNENPLEKTLGRVLSLVEETLQIMWEMATYRAVSKKVPSYTDAIVT